MGITADGLRYLCACLHSGMELGRVLTLGHQALHVGVAEQRQVLREYACGKDGAEGSLRQYADELFLKLGARTVDSMDYSDFEKASLVHDLNRPVPESYHERFDTVYDGGTIEHICNTRMVIDNCMRMLRRGGHLLLAMPANNCMGHGLYQFSPEFVFAVFGNSPSARIRDVLIAEATGRRRWYKVRSFDEVGARVVVANQIPLYLYAVIQKLGRFEEAGAQQADYVASWEDRALPCRRASGVRRLIRRVHGLMPRGVRRRLEELYQKHYVNTLRHRRAFVPISKRNYVLTG